MSDNVKEFEGLKIPIIPDYNTPLGARQDRYCISARCGQNDINCDNCLFDESSIEKFEKWYKQQNKEDIQ